MSKWMIGAAARRWLVAMTMGVSLALASCGGGGGDTGGGDGQVSVIPAASSWNLAARIDADGEVFDVNLGSVSGSAIPSQAMLSQTTVAAFAQQLGQQLAVVLNGYTASVSGTVVRITGPDTDYSITVNSVSVDNYTSCGACGVGSSVSYRVTLRITEGGTFDGEASPSVASTIVTTYIYTRTS